MAIPTPYLQTLSQKDAIAFVASLQKVQAHLSHELAWMKEQMHQKAVQLQGIETLLAEATTSGLPVPDIDTQSISASVSPSSTEPTVDMDSAATSSIADHLEAPSESNGSAAAPGLNEPPAAVEAAPAVKQTNPKSPQPTAKSKPRAPKKGKPTASPKASRPRQQQNQRNQLLPQFAGMALTDVVAQVLAKAAEPLHINELLAAMYENLSGDELKRAKVSLANVLSTGKKQGKWQNVGNGLYQVKA